VLVIVLVLVIDSLDVTKSIRRWLRLTFSHRDPLSTSNGQSSRTSTTTSTSAIQGTP
jgi:hypothetical protein